MIVAKLHGGPQDGAELVVYQLGRIQLPVPGDPLAPSYEDGLSFDVLVYTPELGTLRRCKCRRDCPNAECHYRYRPEYER